MIPVPAADGRSLLVEQLGLRSDCARCTGLCCVGLHLVRSADFAIDKPAGAPCPNLRDDFGCGIHARLRESGFPGCVAYDCLGAGQRVTASVRSAHDGATWRDDPAAARDAFAALPVVTQLHELLWYLAEVLSLPAAAPVHDDARRALDRTAPLADLAPADLLALDVGDVRRDVGPLVDRASVLVRDAARPSASRRPPGAAGAGSRSARGRGRTEGHGPATAPRAAVGHRVPDAGARRRLRPGADLVGADLRGLDLTGSDLRGALLLGADLRGSRLDAVDLLGADLRGADARGADLARALFLTPAQAGAVRRDERTTLPAALLP
ncbi:pentapeptide repeat-containing protein [Cellulosimicrobium cellulans]|uniref:pentapeptide repeat-containing protein n=1 Tax=Cellulosimicrobium cellulans TaxID=1710 RepID=UPI0020980F4A|nr:pentapeptide repeat-containing protein [Cellulosimicrobium cellulans]MCO7275449.1 pentapeptide repeat-containing protein [Cellulosimicrobium cellulans]